MAVSYPILFDNGPDLGKDYMLQKMPVTILVDRAGVVRYSVVGFKHGDERGYLDPALKSILLSFGLYNDIQQMA